MSLCCRVDGNAQIMSGHVMRCLAIAKAVRTLAEAPIFITADHEMDELIISQGFDVCCLNSNWDDLDSEVELLTNTLCTLRADTLLLDSYYVTPAYMECLRGVVRLAYMDDINRLHYPCDILINYNHYAPLLGYEHFYKSSETKLLLDCQYAPLREEFSSLPAFCCAQVVRKVLITTGSGDPYDVAGQLIERLKALPDTAHLDLHVVAGSFNPHLPRLLALAAKLPDVIIHQNVSAMSLLMRSCDIAISAGGSTLYELCACGVPCGFFAFADNQLRTKDAFADVCMLYAGDVRTGAENCIVRLVQCIQRYIHEPGLRQNYSNRMQTLVDGQGAMRLAKALVGGISSPVLGEVHC